MSGSMLSISTITFDELALLDDDALCLGMAASSAIVGLEGEATETPDSVGEARSTPQATPSPNQRQRASLLLGPHIFHLNLTYLSHIIVCNFLRNVSGTRCCSCFIIKIPRYGAELCIIYGCTVATLEARVNAHREKPPCGLKPLSSLAY